MSSWHSNSHSTDTLGKAHLLSIFREVPDMFHDEINILLFVNTPCNMVTHYSSKGSVERTTCKLCSITQMFTINISEEEMAWIAMKLS
jgi:hypothetical protein